ncbi:MAG TPA: diguanylate cyclase, partial [Solirubrobacteraceae bacterium]|nr:diguanylate cyclase [Solirubrobacteraceae bacterium]
MFEADGTAGGPSAQPSRVRVARRGRRRLLRDPALRLGVAAGALWIIGFAAAAYALHGSHHDTRVLRDGAGLAPIALACALSIAAVARTQGRQRAFWTLLAVSNLLWTVGVGISGYTGLVLGRHVPFPSLADGFYLASSLVIPVAVIAAYGRSRELGRALLDCSILGLAVAVAGYLLLIGPQLAGTFGLSTVVGVAYPLLDVVTLILLLSLAFGGHTRVPRAVLVAGAAFTISALTDAGNTYLAVLHSYVAGSWMSVGGQVEAVLLCLAAAIAIRHREDDAIKRLRTRDGGLPAVVAGCALTLIFVMYASLGRVRLLVGLLALYSVSALVLRLWLLMRDQRRVARELQTALSEQQRLAISDGLTGLHNRRFFEEVMKLEADRAMRAQRTFGLIVIDLDHFKQINDSHGHPAGDSVLRETARRLTEVARRSDVVARYGGEEFVLVLPELGPIEILEVGERVRRAVGEHPMLLPDGRAISVTASVGAACLPDHAQTPAELIRAADQALYAAKQHGRNQVELAGDSALPVAASLAREESAFDYLQALVDELEALDGRPDHSREVARWAGRVADALGLSAERRWLTVAAARLLDVGNVTIPDAIIAKRGRLTSREQVFVRRHPVEGARLLRLAPGMGEVAAIVADHHERLDG